MNNNKINIKQCIILAIPLIIIIFFTFVYDKGTSDDIKTGLNNDYYNSINENIINNNELESDKEYWSLMFTKTQDTIDDKVSGIVKEIISKKESYDIDSTEYNICKLYESIIDQENDLSILNEYIKNIDNSNNINELMNNIAKINNELSIGIFINPALQDDYKDNAKTIVNIAPFSFDYGNIYSDYYTNPLYSSYIAIYIEYDREIFELYGYSKEKAKESVRKISRFYTEIANSSKSMEELSEVQNCYNIVEETELTEIFDNININVFLNKYGNSYEISIVDKQQAKVLNDLLVESNLDTLKECAKLQLLQNYGPYADIKYYKLMDKLNAELTGTEITKDTIEDYAIDVVATYFDSEITQIYVSKYAKEESIKLFENIIDDIIKQYKIKIQNNSWLSPTTKQKALLKLENIKVNVGYPKNWEDYSKDYKITNNLLNNVINMNKVIVDYSNNSIINKEDFWLMSPLTVNAYYSPQDNSINFPIALLEYELYNEENSYYKNLGSLGTIIAHEITHAFDNNGALFDEKGNLNNWWTEEDYKEFERLQQQVINYYNQYKINGKSVNGKKTVSENIADLGSISCVVDIARSKNAKDEELKEMFEAYANIWASKSTEEYAKLLLIMDTHSPDKVRVNAVLSSVEEFYRVYNILEGDQMYKIERIKVW